MLERYHPFQISVQTGDHRRAHEKSANDLGPAATGLSQQFNMEFALWQKLVDAQK